MLPRPGKEHYQFGMRDLVKLVKGLQLASKLFHDNQACPLYLLWYTIGIQLVYNETSHRHLGL